MPAFVNMAAMSAMSFRSDALGPLDSVAHPLVAGKYRGEAWRGDVRLGSFVLDVDDDGDGEQIEIDLCTIGSQNASMAAPFRSGQARGYPVYGVFHCDGGTEGLHVIVHDEGEQGPVFDSRALKPGDYYIVTPVRPGNWLLSTGKAGKGVLTVKEPTPGKKPRASAAGAMIKVDDNGFNPAKTQIEAGDGVAFEVTGRDVSIRLVLDAREGARKWRRKVGLRIPGQPTQDSQTAKRRSKSGG